VQSWLTAVAVFPQPYWTQRLVHTVDEARRGSNAANRQPSGLVSTVVSSRDGLLGSMLRPGQLARNDRTSTIGPVRSQGYWLHRSYGLSGLLLPLWLSVVPHSCTCHCLL